MSSRSSPGRPATRSTAALCNKRVNCVASVRRAALPSNRVHPQGNEMGHLSRSCARVGARCRPGRLGLDVAGGRRGTPRFLGRHRQVRRRPAPRDRRRARRCVLDQSASVRRGDVRRVAPHVRRYGHHRDRGRVQGVSHAPRRPSRQARRAGVRGSADRRRRNVGRARARGAVRAPRDQARLRRRLRGPLDPAPAARRRQPSAGARDAARGRSAACAGGSRRASGREWLDSPGSHCAATTVGCGPGRERSGSRALGRVVRSARIDDDRVGAESRLGR
jgi:hypothetical protein